MLIVVAGILLLSAANLAAYWTQAEPEPPTTSQPVTGWDRWRASSSAVRQRLLERHDLLIRRPDMQEVLQRARWFDRLPESRRDYLRRLHGLLQEVVADVDPQTRRLLLRQPARARSFFVYEQLERAQPARLESLRAEARRTLPEASS